MLRGIIYILIILVVFVVGWLAFITARGPVSQTVVITPTPTPNVIVATPTPQGGVVNQGQSGVQNSQGNPNGQGMPQYVTPTTFIQNPPPTATYRFFSNP